MNIEERISRLESKIYNPTIPGTSIARIITDDGMGWTLGLGPMSQPKMWFNGKSIEECISLAEKELLDIV